jgi:hypothetical protein
MKEDSTLGRPQKETLADFFARSPLRGAGIKIERSKETAKPLDLGDAPAPPLNPKRKPHK